MAHLIKTTGEPWLLPPCCLIGRSPTCELRLDDPSVSAEHALLRWRSGVWVIQDLHSRNGTYVDGKALAPGEKVGLEEGAKLGFGERGSPFELRGGSPRAHASEVGGEGSVVEIEGGFLTLPDLDTPTLTILRHDMRWWVERDSGREPILDGELVSCHDRSWRLHLPDELPPTVDTDDTVLSLSSIKLRFTLDEDERLREVTVVRGQREVRFKARAYHSTLYALAKLRERDAARPLPEQGWVAQEQLLQTLGYNQGRLHVEIHRIRRQLAKIEVHVIERHPNGRDLRIGVSRLELTRRPPSAATK